MTYVKICGITNLGDARVAADAGADFLGFIFYPKSPRYVTPEQAREITQGIHADFAERAPRFVGVFVNEPVDAVRVIIKKAKLVFVQLHGAETPDEVTALSPYAFKALRPKTLAEAQETFKAYGPPPSPPLSTATALSLKPLRLRSTVYHPATIPDLLVDAYHPQEMGGTGQLTDLRIAQWFAERSQLLLAGGLTPDNVSDAIKRVHPWGVDVSSGVEIAKGKKDHEKVRAFIKAVSNSAISHQLTAKNG